MADTLTEFAAKSAGLQKDDLVFLSHIAREAAKKGSKFIETLKKKTQEMSYGIGLQRMTPVADLNSSRCGKKKKK